MFISRLTSFLLHRDLLLGWQLAHLHAEDTSQMRLSRLKYVFELSDVSPKDLLANVCSSDRFALVFTSQCQPHELSSHLFNVARLSCCACSSAIVLIFRGIAHATPLSLGPW